MRTLLIALAIATLPFPLLHIAAASPPDKTLPVPANLKPDGIPPLARDTFERIARYGESRSASLLDWHPTRREMLIATRFADVSQIHAVLMPAGARRQLTFYPDRTGRAAYNPADPNEIVFAKDAGGDEFFQLYLMNMKDGKTTLLTAGGRSRNTGPQWSKSGKWLAYTSSKRNGRDSDIWIVDPHHPESARTLLQADRPGWSVAAWSDDDSTMLLNLTKSAVVSELHLIHVNSGTREKIGPADGAHGYFGGVFTPDAKGAYVISNVEGDLPALAYIDLKTHAAKRLREDLKWGVEQLDLSTDGRLLAYVTNEDGIGKMHVADMSTNRQTTLPDIPVGVITGLAWRRGSHELGFALSASETPGDVYSFTAGSNNLERWTYSETGGLDASQWLPANLIHWNSFDGRAISGFVYYPPPKFSGRRPVIVNIHGGPEGQSRPLYSGSRGYFTQELGIVMIYPNVRGSTGYGTEFLNADNGPKREDSVEDIGALLDWIAEQPELDPTRVMVTGGSYGGYMTLAAMTHYSDRIRCAVEIVGISNFSTFLQHTEAYRQDLRRVEYGDERDPKMRDFFETIAPLNNASKITKPIFIVAGRNDPRVPWTEGQQMTDALRKNSVPTWFLVAEDEGHGFAKKKNQDYLAGATAQFVQKYLLEP